MRPHAPLAALCLAALLMTACGEDKAKVEALTAQVSELTAENKRLAADLAAARLAQEQSGTGLNDLQKQFAAATDRLADLGGQLDSAKLAATSAQARYEETLARLSTAEARAAELQSSLTQTGERCQREVDSLRQELAGVQTQLATALKALEEGGSLRDLLPKR
jgi:chromosome segregation ATPase